MPVTPKYTWKEDIEAISIAIESKHFNTKNFDVLVCDVFMNINFNPFLLQLDLLHEINVDTASATRKENEFVIVVKKKESQIWGNLIYKDTRKNLWKRRNESMERKREHEIQLKEKKKQKKYENEKQSLKNQMNLEESERRLIEDLQEEEKKREEKELYDSMKKFHDQEKVREEKSSAVDFATHDDILEAENGCFDASLQDRLDIEEINIAETTLNTSTTIFEEEPSPCFNATIEESPEDEIVFIPEPRVSRQACISFTPRVFPTPSRESKAAEESDWLMKNRKYINKHKGLVGGEKYSQDISETDPMWLKAKGDDFYRSKDFESAINAYTEALESDQTLASCYSNRAACFLKVEKYELCIDDCTHALSLVPDSANLKTHNHELFKLYQLKFKVLLRRGTAYSQLGKFSEAKADYGVAITLNPHNDEVQQDFIRISFVEKAIKYKSKGDDFFVRKMYTDAINEFTSAVEVDPSFVSCIANRAACYLAIGKAKECVEDCTTAILLLQKSSNVRKKQIQISSIIPNPGTERRRQCVIKTLVRRGTAYIELKDYERAEQDYRDALAIDPSIEALKDDLEKLQSLKKLERMTA